MDLKIIEKPLFFLGFFNVLRKSLEVYPRQGQTRKGLPKAGPSQKKTIHSSLDLGILAPKTIISAQQIGAATMARVAATVNG